MSTARRSATLRDQNSVPIPGALLSVIDYAGNAAVLKNDDASNLANPFETDAFGGYVYNTTPGRYTERFTYGGRTVADDRDVVVGTIIAAVDPSPANAGKFVALDASGVPVFASGTGSDSAFRTDAAASGGAALVGFLQAGTGAVSRSAQAKLRDISSAKDFAAVGDGTADDAAAITAAAASLGSGGNLDITSGTYKSGPRLLGPARGNVHAFDAAIVGTTETLSNTTFAGSPATGWTLSNFTSNNPGLTHTAGTVASAKQAVTVTPYTLYLLSITVTTTTQGCVTFLVDGVNIFDAGSLSGLPVGTGTYQFSFFSYNKTGSVLFEIQSDTAWAGSLSSMSLIRVQREAPIDFFSISADKRDFDANFGIKFGKFLSGNVAIGDRLTSALLSDTAAWNTALGVRVLTAATGAIENTGVGALALELNQADRNTAGGYSSFRFNLTGIQNAGWGFKTFLANSTGSNNTGLGFEAGFFNRTASDNTYAGCQAGHENQFGSFNSGFGSMAGKQNSGGASNAWFGRLSGPYSAGAVTFAYSFSSCFGAESKGYGDNTTVVGYAAQAGSDPNTAGTAAAGASAFGSTAQALHANATVVGFGAVSTATNQVTLGNSSVTSLRCAVTSITAISDARDKKDILYIDGGFASGLIQSLHPARWTWDMRGDVPRDGGDIGFIAQDLVQAQTDHNADWLDLVNSSNPDRLEATPGRLIPVLVAALQDALARIAVLEAGS